MSSQLENALDIARPYAQVVVDYLRRYPLAQKALLAVLALAVLHKVNRTLSRWTVNNWRRSEPWNASRELVLLTGGCSGIGKQVMEDLAARTGVKVVILDVQEPKFKLPPNVHFYTADVTSTASIKAVGDKIRKTHGDPTVLVNNAGVGNDGTILEEPEHKIRQTFEVNTMAHFWMVREFLPAMVRANHGHVVTIASMASFLGLGEIADYCGSKASALAFHESLGQELRHYYKAPRVRTSVVHPLWVATPMIQQISDAGPAFKMPILTPETVSKAVVDQIVGQRSGQVILPPKLSHYSLIRAFPTWAQEAARSFGTKQLKDLRDQEEEILKKGNTAKSN